MDSKFYYIFSLFCLIMASVDVKKTSSIRVINCKVAHLRKNGYQSLQAWLDASANHIYVGRNMAYYVPGAVGSKWKNPYTLKKYGGDVQKVLELYREHVMRSGLYEQLGELEGKVLGCWCHPEACHGDVLKEMCEERGKGDGK